MKLLPVLFLAFMAAASAETNSSRMTPMTAEEERNSFHLHEGFTITLVASEEDGVIKPIDLTFDDAGRLWTQTASMYPLDPASGLPWKELMRLRDDPEALKAFPQFNTVMDLYQGRTRGRDKILIIPDPHKPMPSKPIVWADGLAIPQSVLPYKQGTYVTQGSELFLLNDTDGDGKSDQRIRLLTGFGVLDTHTMAHVMIRGPGGWIHFSHGALNKGEVMSVVSGRRTPVNYSKILRMSMDGGRLELISSGLNNIWGFQLRGNGQWFGTEANDQGWSVVPLEEGTGFMGIGNDRLRSYQPMMPPLHEFRVGGTGISGLAFADDTDGSFGKEWKDVALLANPITSAINAVRIVRNADGTVSARHLPDLLTSTDNWFRPVNMEFGPDGCLYVADWYNKIISHNEVALDHPGRDKTHGRIWRICRNGTAARDIPDLTRAKTATLTTHLQSASLWEKRAAWHQIVDRNAKELVPRLTALTKDNAQDPIGRIHALWSLEGLRHYDARLMAWLLKASDDNLRREAVRALASFSLPPATLARELSAVKDDRNVMVRSQVLRTLADAGVASRETIDILVSFCRPDLPGNAMGGSYERKFERYLARRALEQYPDELGGYLKTSEAQRQPASHRFWAAQALPAGPREVQVLALWPEVSKQPLDEATFIAVSELLKSAAVAQAIKPMFDDPANAERLAGFATQNLELVQSPELAVLLQFPARELIRSSDATRSALGLTLAGKLSVPDMDEDVVAAMKAAGADERRLSLALAVLDQQPQRNRTVLAQVAARQDVSFGLKRQALKSLVKADPALAQQELRQKLAGADPAQRQLLAADFAATPQGARVLLDLMDGSTVTLDDFDIYSARLVLSQQPDDRRAQSLSAAWEQREQSSKRATRKRIGDLIKLAQKRGGNPKAGEPIFTGLCLACHVVGNKGVEIAPALDGSAHRDDETLLTSILDPDAAIEMSYRMFRIVKNDGSILDGLLYKADPRGLLVKFMGGGELFVPAEEVRDKDYVPGRSFMPRGLLDSMPDKQIEDRLAYIRTLK